MKPHHIFAYVLLPALVHCSTEQPSSSPTHTAPAAAPAPASPKGSQNANAAAPAGPAAPVSSVRSAPLVDFTANVNPILNSSCGSNSCHGPGASGNVFVGSKATFDGDAANILGRITATDSTVMPPVGYPETLASNDLATLQDYISVTDGVGAVPAGFAPAPGAPGPSGVPGAVPTPFPKGPAILYCANVSAADKATGAAMTFTDLTTIVTADCGGSNCHTSAAQPHGFVGNASTWAQQSEVGSMLVALANGNMPQGKGISAADKAAIVNYICGRFNI